MKLREYRCPWCGNITEPLGLRTEMIKKCSNCGNRYTYHKDGFIWKLYSALWVLTCACSLLVMVNIWIAVISVCVLLMITFSSYYVMSYEQVNDNQKNTYKKYKAKFKFTESELNYIKRRYFMQDKSIIPICFINNNNIAVSNMICICIEGARKTTDNEFECSLSFLPLSNVTYEVKDKNIRFSFFKECKKIGSGMLLGKL